MSRTAVRLAGAFSVLLLLFSVALAATLSAFDQIARAEAEVAALDRAKHAGHLVASLVREQYIHQAHMMIDWDLGHLEHYGEAVEAAHRGVEQLLAISPTAADRIRAKKIADLARENDQEFREKILPLIENGERSSLLDTHDRIQAEVEEVVQTNRDLAADYEARSELARQHAEAVEDRAKAVLLASWILALLFAGILGILILRSVVRPLSALHKGVVQLGEGDLSSRIQWAEPDEFGELAHAFNQMTEALDRNQRDRLRQQKLALLGQVTAGVAHEINNPIGVILGYLKLIKKDHKLTPERLSAMEEEAVQCQRIVGDLLDVVRPLDLSPHRIDLGQIAADAVERFQTTGAMTELRLRLPERRHAFAWGDDRRLRQVVDNLLQNAIDASAGAGPVEVRVSADNGKSRLAVSDSGPGIDREGQDHLFEPFYTTKASGTGLGLAISKAIVDAHSGSIELGKSPWGGATVEVVLPALLEEERRAS